MGWSGSEMVAGLAAVPVFLRGETTEARLASLVLLTGDCKRVRLEVLVAGD